MAKCEYCSSEVVLPFTCPYCGLTFCVEHRLPESHECPSMPTEPFWYQKQKAAQKEIERKGTVKDEESFSDLQFSRSFKNALIATLVIALLIGGSLLMPIIAGTTQSLIIVLLGFLGLIFLIFLILELFKD